MCEPIYMALWNRSKVFILEFIMCDIRMDSRIEI